MPHQFQQSEEPAPYRAEMRMPPTAPLAAQTAARYNADAVKQILADAERLQTHYRETRCRRLT